MRRLLAIVACLINVLPAAVCAAAADPAMRIAVLAPQSARGWTTYRLRVDRAGSPAIVLVSTDAKLATLEINGVVIQRIGREVPLGLPPLGHATPSFMLRNLHPSDRIAVHLEGSSSPAVCIVDNVGTVTGIYTVGLWGGAYYALLATITLFQIAGLFTFANATSAWYAFFVLTMIFSEAAHDGAISFGHNHNGTTLLAVSALSLISFVAFACSFLRLPAMAPRLFRFVLLVGTAPLVTVGGIVTFAHWQIDNNTLVLPCLLTNITLIAISVIRRLSGYKPALLFCFATSGLTTLFLAKVFGDLTGTSIEFLDRWGFEIGGAFDVFAFSVAVSHRSQFMLREGRRLKGELEAATFAAMHDPLTHLLNRRGLEERCAETPAPVGTVLYLDIDGFKRVNDGGGHAAGDAALCSLADIVRDAVRNVDVVTRVGGDEFVVLLIDITDEDHIRAIIDRITTAVNTLRPLGDKNPTRIGVSIGVGRLTRETTFEWALAQADADAYRIKTQHYRDGGSRLTKR